MLREKLLKKYNIKTNVIEIPNVTRDDLAEFLAENELNTGAEIGVAAGEYSEILMQANPHLTLFGVDPWEPYSGYKDFARLGTFNSLEAKAHERLDKYENYHFIKKYSLDAANQIPNESLDFVYIDANHSEPYVTQDIETWFPKVRVGGVVAGHDYARIKAKGIEDSTNWAVIPAVHRFAEKNNLQIYVWGLEAKLPGLKRDGSRSWMYIK